MIASAVGDAQRFHQAHESRRRAPDCRQEAKREEACITVRKLNHRRQHEITRFPGKICRDPIRKGVPAARRWNPSQERCEDEEKRK